MKQGKLVYKQLIDATWVGNNGSKILPVVPNHEDDFETYQLIDNNGVGIATGSLPIDLVSNAEFYNYADRTGRRLYGKPPTKLGPWHFPTGTIVTVTESLFDKDKIRQFTVNHIFQNGPRSYVLSMDEMVTRKHINDGKPEPYSFNISHVTGIVKLGSGEVTFDRKWGAEKSPMEFLNAHVTEATRRTRVSHHLAMDGIALTPCRKGEVLWVSTDYWLTATLISSPENEQRSVNHDRIRRFIKHGGFARWIESVDYFGDKLHTYAINKRKFAKWVAKNAHRVFYSLSHDEADEYASNLSYYDDAGY